MNWMENVFPYHQDAHQVQIGSTTHVSLPQIPVHQALITMVSDVFPTNHVLKEESGMRPSPNVFVLSTLSSTESNVLDAPKDKPSQMEAASALREHSSTVPDANNKT